MKKLLVLYLFSFWMTIYGEGKKTICIIANEPEYQTAQTLKRFAEQLLKEKFNLHYVVANKDNPHSLVGLEILDKTDLLILSVRRMALPPEQLAQIKNYLKKGKPLLAVRTATHAFVLNKNDKAPQGTVEWVNFDQEILGCRYTGHYAPEDLTSISLVSTSKNDVTLQAVKPFTSRSWLYKVSPLAETAKVLLTGKLSDNSTEPVAWLYKNNFGGQVVTTTLGHQEDFLEINFANFLYNSTLFLMGQKPPKTPPVFKIHNDFLEENFPFFTTTLDATKLPTYFPKDNLSSRGLIIKMGNDSYACFDTDLLKYSVFWQGEFILLNTMAPVSYDIATNRAKSPQGENQLPKIKGKPLIALGNIPGVEKEKSTWLDPRDKNLNLLAKGPIAPELGKWQGIHLTAEGAVIVYTIGKTTIYESLKSHKISPEIISIERQIKAMASNEKLIFHLGQFGDKQITINNQEVSINIDDKNSLILKGLSSSKFSFNQHPSGLDLIVEPTKELNLSLFMALVPQQKMATILSSHQQLSPFPNLQNKLPTLWQEKEITSTKVEAKSPEDELQLTDIVLPVINSYHRNLRISGIDFFKDGRAAICTFDGDVWVVENIHDHKNISWKRFASGLYEPLTLKIKDEKIYVFDRIGIIRLHDQDNNGEADFYENFSNLPIQTPESREFAMDFVFASDGTIFLAKGGQRTKTVNPHAGCIIKISSDGSSMQTIATGLREPFLGIDPKTNDIFASDQQGNFVPTTPFHFIQSEKFYGYDHQIGKMAKMKITEPTTWIPHRINQSGAGLIKIYCDKMKQFDNSLLYLDYYGASLAKIYFDRTRPEEAVYLRLKQNFNFPLLKGAVNPQDGLLYLCGFQIWGTQTTRTAGLARLAPLKNSQIPANIQYFKQGILLAFNEKINKNSISLNQFKIELWNYLRTEKYGSAHYKLNGENGQETVLPASATLSNDGKSIFVAIPDMKKCMQMSFSWTLSSEANSKFEDTAFFSVNTLNEFLTEKENFPKIDFSLKAISMAIGEKVQPSIALGEKTVVKFGCVGCHSTSKEKEEKVGPPWGGIFKSKRKLTDKSEVLADEAYLKESILEPATKTLEGYKPDMPSYKGILQDYELESVILYLKSLE